MSKGVDVVDEISRSSEWPEMCVGKLICCTRLYESKTVLSAETPEERGSSMCMLKSPVTKSSHGEMTRSESRAENSARKTVTDELGGR